MITNGTKTERIKISILEELDKLKYIHRRDSYSERIRFLLKYCKKNKENFNKWLKQEVDDEKL